MRHGLLHCVGQLFAAAAIALQQMKRHALRRFGAHTGQHPQGVDEIVY
jgi:hypothetical protein